MSARRSLVGLANFTTESVCDSDQLAVQSLLPVLGAEPRSDTSFVFFAHFDVLANYSLTNQISFASVPTPRSRAVVFLRWTDDLLDRLERAYFGGIDEDEGSGSPLVALEMPQRPTQSVIPTTALAISGQPSAPYHHGIPPNWPTTGIHA